MKLKYLFVKLISALIFIDGDLRFDPRHSGVDNDGIVSRLEETCCASFCEVWLKDIGPPSRSYAAILRFALSPEANEFGWSWNQVSVAHSRKLSSEYRRHKHTASALRARSAPNSTTSYTSEPSK